MNPKNELIGDVAILPLPVRGFEGLELKDKMLAYHLYQSAVAGRDINFDQNYRYNLRIRKMCEEVLLHSKGIEQKVLEDVAHYLTLIYVHAGVHEKFTYVKFTPPPSLTYEKLAQAVEAAMRNGADIPFQIDELKAPIFDANVDRYCTTHSPEPGEDMVSASAVNFYETGIRMKDLENFSQRYRLNSKVVRANGQLKEEVWRLGGDVFQAIGRSGPTSGSGASVCFKEYALSLRHLIEFYRTGELEDFRRFNIDWLSYDRPTIDMINGFTEVYKDPLQAKASWEGTLYFVSETSSGWLREVAKNADYFEKRTPYKDKYKRSGVKPIANMVEVLIQTGDGGPISASGVNLPNEQSIREKYGKKNILLWNNRDTKAAFSDNKIIDEFIWPEDRELVRKYNKAATEVFVGFHEALGHASGKNSEKLTADPAEKLSHYYSWLEEERADLNALHHAWDPKIFEIRKDWNEDGAKSLYKRYAAMQMFFACDIPEGSTTLIEPHVVGGNFAINYFMKKWNVVEEVKRTMDGKQKTFFIVRDENIPLMRKAVAELLAELQRIKSEGDLQAIEKLAQTYSANTVNGEIMAEYRSRKKELSIPTYYAYLYPSMELVTNGGKTSDVELTYPKSLLHQQMTWSGYGPDQLIKLPSWV